MNGIQVPNFKRIVEVDLPSHQNLCSTADGDLTPKYIKQKISLDCGSANGPRKIWVELKVGLDGFSLVHFRDSCFIIQWLENNKFED